MFGACAIVRRGGRSWRLQDADGSFAAEGAADRALCCLPAVARHLSIDAAAIEPLLKNRAEGGNAPLIGNLIFVND